MNETLYLVEYREVKMGSGGSELIDLRYLIANTQDEAKYLAFIQRPKRADAIGVYEMIAQIDVAEEKAKEQNHQPRKKPMSYKDYLARYMSNKMK